MIKVKDYFSWDDPEMQLVATQCLGKKGQELKDFLGKWSRKQYSPSAKHANSKFSYGGDKEPCRTIYLSSFADAADQFWDDNIKILDCGCGCGKLFNFASSRLGSFKYYGIEVPNSRSSWGELSIANAISNYAHDERARFGFLGTQFWKVALRESNVAFLISILTHMDEKRAMGTIRSLLPVIQKGCCVFSVHHDQLEKSYEVGHAQFYGFEKFHEKTYLSHDFLKEMAFKLGLELSYWGDYRQPNTPVVHSIYRLVS